WREVWPNLGLSWSGSLTSAMVTLPLGPVAGCAVGPVPLGEAGPAGAQAARVTRAAMRSAERSFGSGPSAWFRPVGRGLVPRRKSRRGTSPRPTGTRRPNTSHRAGSLGVHDLGLEEGGAGG